MPPPDWNDQYKYYDSNHSNNPPDWNDYVFHDKYDSWNDHGINTCSICELPLCHRRNGSFLVAGGVARGAA